jgi:hypothetical protein
MKPMPGEELSDIVLPLSKEQRAAKKADWNFQRVGYITQAVGVDHHYKVYYIF